MRKRKPEILKPVTLRVPDSIHQALKVYSATSGLKLQAIVAQAIRGYLEAIK